MIQEVFLMLKIDLNKLINLRFNTALEHSGITPNANMFQCCDIVGF